MKSKLKFLVLLLFVSGFVSAQTTSDDVLFTVDGDPVKASEFIRVYNKNLDLVKDESQKDVDEYLKLFVNYQLKIKEAKRLGLDDNAQYKREFANYKKQLTKNFLTDNKVTDALVKEAYDRMSYDIKASHILFRVEEAERDTLKVYNDLLELRERAKKEGFESVFKELNTKYKAPGSREINYKGHETYAEELGYFSAFKMVYNFETVAYNTEVGEISMPFRTRFGYHIVMVEDKRPSRGEVTVEHIMVSKVQKDSSLNPEVRINELYKKIMQGESFEAVAKQFSDDKSSAAKGGLLPSFKGGQLSSSEFEEVAFGLTENGQISEPFKTEFGWHIVKLIDKTGNPEFDTIKLELEQRVKRDSRSALINTALTNNLKQRYSVKDNQEALTYFEGLINASYFQNNWTLPGDFIKDKTFITIGKQDYTYGAFGDYLVSSQRKYFGKQLTNTEVVAAEYEAFLEAKLIDYRERNLEFEDEEFAFILGEYRDGLLLFDLMEKEVWNTASKDTVGLKSYYESHKADYVWPVRADAVVASAAKKRDISKVEDLLEDNKSVEEISDKLNTESEQKVIFTKGIMDTTHQALPEDFEFKKGVSSIYKFNDSYHVAMVEEVYPSGPKTFEEARGSVVSDYQNYIEENWLNTLHERYNVEINQDVLAKVKSQILN